jgi:hypothetical protein
VRCSACYQPIAPGLDARKRAEYRRQPDGTLEVFGIGMPGGPLARASGPLVKAEHGRCYWAAEKARIRAAIAQERIAADRSSDAGYQPAEPADWRDQSTAEV